MSAPIGNDAMEPREQRVVRTYPLGFTIESDVLEALCVLHAAVSLPGELQRLLVYRPDQRPVFVRSLSVVGPLGSREAFPPAHPKAVDASHDMYAGLGIRVAAGDVVRLEVSGVPLSWLQRVRLRVLRALHLRKLARRFEERFRIVAGAMVQVVEVRS